MYRILVVDDSMIIRNRISRIDLKIGTTYHYEIVASAKNGREAIAKCKEYQPDIITLDLTMPEMDGLEVIPKLLAIKPNLLILVISALSDNATGLAAIELGAHGFVNKPFTDKQVRDSLDAMVTKDKKNQEKKEQPKKKGGFLKRW